MAWLALLATAFGAVGVARASCKTPVPVARLQALDASVDDDPLRAIGIAVEALRKLPAPPSLEGASLYAIIADANDTINDDVELRKAVDAARAQLAGLPETADIAALKLRLVLVESDGAQTRSQLEASVAAINEQEARVDRQSLGYACLLLVRGRIQGRLLRPELAAKDGLHAYELSSQLDVPDARSEAAYQLGNTYRRAGLYDDALRMSDEVVSYTRAKRQNAALSMALWARAQILGDAGSSEQALQVLAESQRLSVAIKDELGVAFAEHERCNEMIALARLPEAEHACLLAVDGFRKAQRTDQLAGSLGALARIDLLRGRPAAALSRLQIALADDGRHLPPGSHARMYQNLADALSGVGREREALEALKKSVALSKEADERRRSLAVAVLAARQESERYLRDRQMLSRQVQYERERADSRELTRRLAIELAVAIALVAGLLGYLLFLSMRHGRELRNQEAMLRQSSDNAPDPLVLLDAAGRTRFANRGMFARDDRPEPAAVFADYVPEDARKPVATAIKDLLQTRQPVAVEVSLATRIGVRHFDVRGLPIMSDGRLIGATLRATDVTERRNLEREVLDVATRERQRLSSDLHEGVSQALAGISFQLHVAVSAAQQGRSDAYSTLPETIAQFDRAIASVNSLARDLSPVQTERGSLSLALERLAHDLGAGDDAPRITMASTPANISVPERVADHLYRIGQEAVSNAVRYASARNIAIDLTQDGEFITLAIADDGVGFATGTPIDGLGLRMMGYRARLLGGSLRFVSAPGSGTRVVAVIPFATSRPSSMPDQ